MEIAAAIVAFLGDIAAIFSAAANFLNPAKARREKVRFSRRIRVRGDEVEVIETLNITRE